MPFHVELRDGRDSVRMFNLSEAEVISRFITPLRVGRPFVVHEQEFEPQNARLTVLEGRTMGPGELGPGGVGWANAAKRGEDVTQRFLAGGAQSPAAAATLEAAGRLKERILGRLAAGPLPLGEGLALTTDLMAGHRVSERLGAVEMAVWEMLHGGAITLAPGAGDAPLAPDQWEAVVLDPATWLASGPDSPVIAAA